MNKPTPKQSGTKKTVLTLCLVAIACLSAWVAYFLFNLDLNVYRDELETRLSSQLSLDVKLGLINYEIHGGNLALQIDQIRVGDENSPIEFDASELTVDLDWLGLFSREIKFSTLSVSQPTLTARAEMTREKEDIGAPAVAVSEHVNLTLFQNIQVEGLEIEDGTINLVAVGPEGEKTISAHEIHGSISETAFAEMSGIDLAGKLLLAGQKQLSPWHIKGDAGFRYSKDDGLQSTLDLEVQCNNTNLGALSNSLYRPSFSGSIRGQADINLQMRGTYPRDLDVQLEVTSDGVSLLPNLQDSSPVTFDKLVANGRYSGSKEKSKLSGLFVQLDESSISAHVEWQNTPPFSNISTQLKNSNLEIAQLKNWLSMMDDKWQTISASLSDQGVFHLKKGELSFVPSTEPEERFQIKGLEGEFKNVNWLLADSSRLEIESLPLQIDGNTWQIDKSPLVIGSFSLTAEAQGTFAPDRVQVDFLDFNGKINPEKLLDEKYFPKSSLQTDGDVLVQGHLEGPYEKMALDMQVDLSQLNLTHPAGLQLTPGDNDRLSIHATITPERISLDHGSIKWSVASGHINGKYDLSKPDSLELDALLSIEDLTRIAENLPLLDRMDLRGQADLNIRQRGDYKVASPELTLTLRDAGMKASRHIADLNNINGRISLTPDGFQAKEISVHLGESPLSVDAELTDFTDPHLYLKVKGPAVRARDIVFYSESAILRNVDGALEVTRNGLTFDSIKVQLDGGTDAALSGTIAFAPPYPVDLDIRSEYGLISEVIGLWSDRPKIDPPEPATSGEARQKTPVTINAEVKSGDLYGMKFSNASGIIRAGREQLVIHPLDFSVGDGYCNAQVITDFRTDSPSLLRVSGHAEDVDALEVYRELLNQRSIVKGKLRGDFYLTGELGSNYLPSSYGHFNIQIRDGVLHRFPIISKVFSLLNVSQVFSLQLPDMDLEGMPFNNLTGNLQLDEGVLSSNNLVIESAAMNQSYIGQLNLVNKEVELLTSIQPLGTVDKIVSRIPIAGWLLTGEDEVLLSAHFKIRGKTDSVSVTPLPLETISEPSLGLLRRTLSLPFKIVEDPQILWGGKNKPDVEKK